MNGVFFWRRFQKFLQGNGRDEEQNMVAVGVKLSLVMTQKMKRRP